MRKQLFKHWGFKLPLLLGILMVSMVLASGVALAAPSPSVPSISSGSISDFTGNYYYFQAPPFANATSKAHPDLQRAITGVVTGLVDDNLTGGLPTYTGKLDSSGNKYINDFDWWTSARLVHTEDDGSLSGIPTSNFFPIRPTYKPTVNGMVNGTQVTNYNGYDAVHWTATLTVNTAGNFSFNMGSDDDSWLFIGNNLVLDLGGVHDNTAHTSGVKYLTPGTYPVDIFYADRYIVQAGFSFSANIPTHAGAESFPILPATPSYFEKFGS